MSNHLATTLAAFLLAVPVAGASAGTGHIVWKDLRPAMQAAAENPGLPMIAAKLRDHGETLSLDLRGKTIQLAGYALPIDRDGDLVYQFLLVPWTGVCSHTPTPQELNGLPPVRRRSRPTPCPAPCNPAGSRSCT